MDAFLGMGWRPQQWQPQEQHPQPLAQAANSNSILNKKEAQRQQVRGNVGATSGQPSRLGALQMMGGAGTKPAT